jgi:hypothetical protein
MHQVQFGVPLRHIRDDNARAGKLMALALGQASRQHAWYYLEFAKSHRSDFRALHTDGANITLALDYCLREEDWRSVAGFVTALSDFWIRSGLGKSF